MVRAEFIFSAIFPLFAVIAGRYGAIKLLLCYLPIGLIIRAIAHYSSPHPIVWLSDGLAIGRFDEFIWGMVLAELLASSRIPKRPLAMLFLSVLVILPTLAGINASISGRIPHYCMAFLTTTFDLGIALAISAAICGRSLFSRSLTVKPLRVMGMACYSIYLWHMPLLSQLRLHIDPWNVPVLFSAVVYLTILSAITYRYVEFRRVEDWRSLFLIGPMMTKSRPIDR